MPAMQHTPPSSPMTPGNDPALVLCADGGGSKVCVVIRTSDGVEVRGVAGPCNVQSVGHGPAIQAILLATYRALSLLPSSYLPEGFSIPTLPPPSQTSTHLNPSPTTHKPNGVNGVNGHAHLVIPTAISAHSKPLISTPSSPFNSRPSSPRLPPLPPLNAPLFRYVWLGLAGISADSDAIAFLPTVLKNLNTEQERVKITNDVNLLAAPALNLPGIQHVAAVVCGTGTVGRTIEIAQKTSTDTVSGKGGEKVKGLPLTDVGVSRGWGWLLCDEGSAFWIGRLAIRALLFHVDRNTRSSLYSNPAPPLLPFHNDLLSYFGVEDPMELIAICSLIGPSGQGLSIGEATAKRNAYLAGAARIVLKWAFPEDGITTSHPPSPPRSDRSDTESSPLSEDSLSQSKVEAQKLVYKAIQPLIDLTLDLLGDGSVVKPRTTALALGGGLWNSKGYRSLLQEGLKREGVEFAHVLLVDDAAGVGAAGLARVEFGL